MKIQKFTFQSRRDFRADGTLTVINTARSKNKADHKGMRIYPTRSVRGQKGSYTWCKEIAPTPAMSKQIKEGNNYEYEKHLYILNDYYDLTSKESWYAMFNFIKLLQQHPEVTLICFCEDINKCHRKVLANWLVDNYPQNFILGEIK